MKNSMYSSRKAIYSSFFILHFSFLLFFLSCGSPAPEQPKLENGDLLFTLSEADASTLSGAIVGATSQSTLPIDHVAIVCIDSQFPSPLPHGRGQGWVFVLESTTRHGVRLCPLDTFLVHADHNAAGQPLVMAGRIKGDFDCDASLRNAMSYLGRHYDDVYSPTDDDIYCSELVQKSYVDHEGQLIFTPEPMSFHDADGNILPYWAEFYAYLGLPVPEGEPGSNPVAIATHPSVQIIGSFFTPE